MDTIQWRNENEFLIRVWNLAILTNTSQILAQVFNIQVLK